MNDFMKTMAEDILVNTARYNWESVMDNHPGVVDLREDDYMELMSLLNSANISISWD